VSEAVQRATELIEFVASEPRTLREVSEHFGVHRSTVFRQLKTLESAGFLVHRDEGTWAVGMRLIAIAQQALDGLDLRRVAHDNVRALHREVGNTVHLAQLIGNKVIYIDKVDDPDGVRMSSRIGGEVVPTRTGVGKAILAQLSAAARSEVIAAERATVAPGSVVTEPRQLDAELEQIRARGWAIDDGLFEDFVNCIAVPVRNSTGAIVGALSISAIRAVSDLDALSSHLDSLLASSRDISRQLG
jgi:DNA-binding IclR family transcriptional regulator